MAFIKEKRERNKVLNKEQICRKIIDTVFINIPLSKNNLLIKKKMLRDLEDEYDRKMLEGNLEIHVIGHLIKEYSTIEDLEKLSGIDKSEIQGKKTVQNKIEKCDLIRYLRKINILSIFIGFITAILFIGYANILLAFNINTLILSIIYIVVLFVSVRFLIKKIKQNKNNHYFNTEAYNAVEGLIDKYKKRFLNSFFLSVIMTFYVIYLIIILCVFSDLVNYEINQVVLSNLFLIGLSLFLIIKNAIRLYSLEKYSFDGYSKKYIKIACRIIICSLIYFGIVVVILFLYKGNTIMFFNIYWIANIIYIVAIAFFNFRLRCKYLNNNIVFNRKRIIAYSLIFIMIIMIICMRMDTWILQPYISTVSSIKYEKDAIEYNDENGVYTITTEKEKFNILQLTDIHLGGSVFSSQKDLKALKAVYSLIETTKPDLVVITGDLVFPLGIMSFSFNNQTPIIQFASFMRNIGVPWAFTYGNHDTESIANSTSEQIDDLFKSLSYKTSNNLLYPYIQPEIYGRSNQMIEIRNDDNSIRQAIFLLDSNSYTGNGVNDYDYIHDEQVDWYENQLKIMCEKEQKLVPSIMFFHMPLQEYKQAYELYMDNSKDIKFYFGENGEKMIDKVCCSKYPSKLFKTAKRIGSTKAMFCGHDHYNNLSVEYEGIRLTYGMSIDYLAMPGIENDYSQRGGTLITINNDSTVNIEQIELQNK